MRLKPERVEALAELVFETLAANAEVTIEETREHVTGLIRKVITDDLRAEDELEEDARALLEQHREEIDRKGASYEKLLMKAKQKLAQERKMVL